MFFNYNIVIFIVIVSIGLIFAIFTLNNSLQRPAASASSSSSSINTGIFDQATVSRLDKLHTSGENTSNQTLPSGKINPFNE